MNCSFCAGAGTTNAAPKIAQNGGTRAISQALHSSGLLQALAVKRPHPAAPGLDQPGFGLRAQASRRRCACQAALGTPLAARHGYGAPLVGSVRDRAIALCEKLGDTQHLLPSLYGQYAYCIASGRIPEAFAYAERCQTVATCTGDRVARLIAQRAMAASLAAMGDYEAARAQLEPFLALENAEKDRSLSVNYVTDPQTSGLGFLALTQTRRGPTNHVMDRSNAVGSSRWDFHKRQTPPADAPSSHRGIRRALQLHSRHRPRSPAARRKPGRKN